MTRAETILVSAPLIYNVFLYIYNLKISALSYFTLTVSPIEAQNHIDYTF